MSNVVETIIISSDEESDVKIIEEIHGFRLSRSKLKDLKSRRQRNTLRSIDSTNNNVIKNNALVESKKESPVKSSPSQLVRLDKAKFKELKAVVKIELKRSPDSKLNTKRSVKKGKSVMLF